MNQLTRNHAGRRARLALFSAASLLAGCGGHHGGEPAPLTVTVSPSHALMFGDVALTLTGDFSALGEIQSVTFDGIQALDVAATSSTITLRIQGAPTPGPAHLVIAGTGGQGISDTAFAYDAPTGGAPLTWAAFGASLTMGAQSAGLAAHGQLMSWDAQIARAAGVYLAPPLVVDSLAPPLQPAAFVQSCATGISEGTVAANALMAVTDPNTHQPDLRRGRLDATLATRNFSVGGATVADVILPATGAVGIIERVLELPDGDPSALFGPPLTRSQVDRLVALDPDVAVSADLLANDAEGALTANDLNPDGMTPLSTIVAELQTLAQRLGALHGQYFIGNLPPLDLIPSVSDRRRTAIAAGIETEASFDAKVAQMRANDQQYNQVLAAAVAPYPNLHVVDLWTAIQVVASQGVTIGGEKLTATKFGGLFSLDFLHFTDTGYALLGNVFIEAIDQTLGLTIPEVDVAAVLAADPLSPANLAADGVHCPAQ
jgi:hypothetical protein